MQSISFILGLLAVSLILAASVLHAGTMRWPALGFVWLAVICAATWAVGDHAMTQSRVTLQAFLQDTNTLSTAAAVMLAEIMVFISLAVGKMDDLDGPIRPIRRDWAWQWLGISPFLSAYAMLSVVLIYLPSGIDLDLAVAATAGIFAVAALAVFLLRRRAGRVSGVMLEVTVVVRVLAGLAIAALLSVTQGDIPPAALTGDMTDAAKVAAGLAVILAVGFAWQCYRSRHVNNAQG